jgi:hypothetical protein
MHAMSESADAQSKRNSRQADSSDRQALAHVEKWLAVIREISSERRS